MNKWHSILVLPAIFCVAALVLLMGSGPAAAQSDPGDERASAFVVGDGDPEEEFGPVEGPLLLGLGILFLVLVFGFLFVAGKTQDTNARELGALESKLVPGENHDPL